MTSAEKFLSAILHENENVVEEMLRTNCFKNSILCKAMHICCLFGKTDVVKLLLRCGKIQANCNCTECDREPLICSALHHQAYGVVELLLKYGFKSEHIEHNYDAYNPLQRATEDESIYAVNLLLKYGENAIDRDIESSPLVIAAVKGNEELIEAFKHTGMFTRKDIAIAIKLLRSRSNLHVYVDNLGCFHFETIRLMCKKSLASKEKIIDLNIKLLSICNENFNALNKRKYMCLHVHFNELVKYFHNTAITDNQQFFLLLQSLIVFQNQILRNTTFNNLPSKEVIYLLIKLNILFFVKLVSCRGIRDSYYKWLKDQLTESIRVDDNIISLSKFLEPITFNGDKVNADFFQWGIINCSSYVEALRWIRRRYIRHRYFESQNI